MITLPSINYIIFQLLSYPFNQPQKIREERIVVLDVIPTQLDYRLTSRDAVYQTGESIFTDHFPLAPTQVTLSGTFGNVPRPFVNNFLTGMGRLKQMELLFRQSKSTDDDKLFEEYLKQNGVSLESIRSNPALQKDKQAVYVLNYYDFIFQQFFAVNLQSFRFFGNARQNTQMKFYDLQFSSVGKLYDVQSRDPLLSALNTAHQAANDAVTAINNGIISIQNNPYVKGIETIIDIFAVAAAYHAEIVDSIGLITGTAQQTTQDVISLV